MYDIIGDIHGFADTLEELLHSLGYAKQQGVYRHPKRKAVFTGDFIDRGPKIRKTLHITESMVRNGHAFSVAGNHEFNAVGYFTADKQGNYLRPHSEKNMKQIAATLAEFEDHPDEFQYYLNWFKSLPFYLELPDIRVVHACWNVSIINELIRRNIRDASDINSLIKAFSEGSFEYEATEIILKGKELKLPDDYYFLDKEDIKRQSIRVRWWEDLSGKRFADAVVNRPEGMPDLELPESFVKNHQAYQPGDKPVFFGHYWLWGKPEVQKPNVCCLDYSIGKCGKLTAYRFDGEKHLDNSKFVSVPCIDNVE